MILYSAWTRLPLPTRILISQEFGFAKTGPTHVQDNRIVSDGYKIEDIENSLNLENMRSYVGVDQTDLATLFELVVAKIEGRKIEEAPLPETPSIPEPIVAEDTGIPSPSNDVVKPKRKYTKKIK